MRWRYKVVIDIIIYCIGYDISKIDTRREAVLFDIENAYQLAKQMKECTSFHSIKSLWDSMEKDPLFSSYLTCFIEEFLIWVIDLCI